MSSIGADVKSAICGPLTRLTPTIVPDEPVGPNWLKFHQKRNLLPGVSRHQCMPLIAPSPETVISTAEGSFGSPGMVMIVPEMSTTNPAPAESRTSRIGTSKPLGAPRTLGSVENEYCVLAKHTGRCPQPDRWSRDNSLWAAGVHDMFAPPYTFVTTACAFFSSVASAS